MATNGVDSASAAATSGCTWPEKAALTMATIAATAAGTPATPRTPQRIVTTTQTTGLSTPNLSPGATRSRQPVRRARTIACSDRGTSVDTNPRYRCPHTISAGAVRLVCLMGSGGVRGLLGVYSAEGVV